jgi:DNA-binding GntR family transcriptional regulator
MSSVQSSALSGPVVRSSLVDEVRERLATAIVNRELPPGSRLIEARLASELGVSRGPVREALRELERRGLTVSSPRGFSVPDFSFNDLSELMQLRLALERLAIALAVERMQPAGLLELEADIRDMEHAVAESPEDQATLARLDSAFHEHLCELSGHQRLLHLLRAMSDEIRLAISTANLSFERREGYVEGHAAIVDALRAGDKERCEEVIGEHIRIGLAACEAARDRQSSHVQT